MEVEERLSPGMLTRLSRYAGTVAGGVAVLGTGIGHACDRSAKAVGCMLASGKKQEEECCSEDTPLSVMEEPVSEPLETVDVETGEELEEAEETEAESASEETLETDEDAEATEPSDTDTDEEPPPSV